MKEAGKLVVLVVAAYFSATFVHLFTGQKLLALPEPQHRITFVLVPVIFFLILLPLISAGKLPRVSISLRKPALSHWALLAGLGLAASNWTISNLIAVGHKYLTSSPEATTAVIGWGCRWPLAAVPELLLKMIPIPVMEEICFRGMVMGIFLARGRPRLGIFVSAITFAAYHSNYLEAFLAGIILGLIYWRTRDLGLVIVAHVTHNFLVTLDSQCFHVDWMPSAAWGIAGIAVTIVGIAFSVWAISHLPEDAASPSSSSLSETVPD